MQKNGVEGEAEKAPDNNLTHSVFRSLIAVTVLILLLLYLLMATVPQCRVIPSTQSKLMNL